MSGFTRDTYHYGDKLVYEALHSKWDRYHSTHCQCGQDWITAHAEPAGFTVVRSDSGFTSLTGPGLTEGVDESTLTANALWEAVTGKPGTQDWYEQVRVVDRSPEAQATQKAASDAHYAKLRDALPRPKSHRRPPSRSNTSRPWPPRPTPSASTPNSPKPSKEPTSTRAAKPKPLAGPYGG
ncbi:MULTISPECIES: hypothetical protein [Nocardia]|uniref:hypothetical protein n=1 Tax=Nocardia TaxID=1817 RepID=UPI0007E96D15|nr:MULTISPECIES: hypothetical protein [Nocardia]MBF6272893.1 hypothetical protein [Nocardia nova]OBA49671.1 hypothetical protein A5789_30420 [Nocardia sp. 852002-51101_SCH5132738]OBB52920.1 hypothetical protein A5748_15135 [Nocardia sp. 852002-51244_SCH5132740]